MTKRDRPGLNWGEGAISERVREDGSVRYVARWMVNDGLHITQKAKSFDTRDAAEDHLRDVYRAKRERRYAPPSEMTVSQLVAEYIARAGSRVSARTVLTYTLRAERMIDPTIGKRKLDALTPLDVQRWIDGLGKTKAARGKAGFAPSTIHAAVAVLMGALREAAVLGITDRHLGQGIRRPTIGPSTAVTWTAEQAARVLAAVRDNEIYGALYHVALATGMRPGELRALSWKDVDLDAGVITVRRTMSRDASGAEIVAERTKGKTTRAVAIAPAIVERLRWHRLRQHERRLACQDWQDLGLVFDGERGHWIWVGPWQRYHREVCEAAKVPAIRAHDLRHTAATLMVGEGIHPKIIADILGHANISITMDRYSHPTIDHQRPAIERLTGLFAAESRPKPPSQSNGEEAHQTG